MSIIDMIYEDGGDFNIYKPREFMDDVEVFAYETYLKIKNDFEVACKFSHSAHCDSLDRLERDVKASVRDFYKISGEDNYTWLLYSRSNPDRKKELLNKFFDGKYNDVVTV